MKFVPFTLLLALALGAGSAANAQNVRMATTGYNGVVSSGTDLSVRRMLNDLRAGDYVSSIEVIAQAQTPGAALQLVIDDVIIQTVRVPAQQGYVSFVVNKRNGVDYGTLMIRADGQVYVQTVMATIQDGASVVVTAPTIPQPELGPGDIPAPPPVQPIPNRPPPPPMPQPAAPGTGDRPHFPDGGPQRPRHDNGGPRGPGDNGPRGPMDLNLHKQAYDFAYSSDGLDLDQNGALRYADSIASRPGGAAYLTELRQIFSYARNNLGLPTTQARAFAEARVGTGFQNNLGLYTQAYQFAYADEGFDLDPTSARAYAESIIRRGDGQSYLTQVRSIFSYARNNLGLSKAEARSFAEAKVLTNWNQNMGLYTTAYQFAYADEGFDLDPTSARAYAEAIINRVDGQGYLTQVRQLFSFARNNLGLDKVSARQWAERKVMEPGAVSNLGRYSQIYQFAYGSEGLDLDPASARAYADSMLRRGDSDRAMTCIRQNFSYARNNMGLNKQQARDWSERRCF